MQFAFRRTSSPVAYSAMSVRTGTRDEGCRPGGLAHFTEHLIFKGTETRSGSVINSCIERLGGELNAYTTKEETVLHTMVLKEDLPKAVDLLVDLAFRSVFPEKEIEKERTVVLEEIKSYKDSPADQIFDDFEEKLFEGTALSMPVLGKSSTLRKITREDLLSYYHTRFVPGNMCFTIAADIEEKKALLLVRKALRKYGIISPTDTAQTSPEYPGPSRPPVPADSIKPFRHETSKHHHQVHCIIGCSAYSLYDSSRIPLVLLCNYLGGPAANSTLNIILRERNAMVYGVDAAYTQYEETGVVTIYFGCDAENADRCRSLVFKELARVRENLLSATALRQAKKQLLGQLAISSDSGEAQVLSMGKNLMAYGNIPSREQIRSRIEAITSEELRQVAREIFAPERLSILLYR